MGTEYGGESVIGITNSSVMIVTPLMGIHIDSTNRRSDTGIVLTYPLPCPCYAGLDPDFDPGLDPEGLDPEFADG